MKMIGAGIGTVALSVVCNYIVVLFVYAMMSCWFLHLAVRIMAFQAIHMGSSPIGTSNSSSHIRLI